MTTQIDQKLEELCNTILELDNNIKSVVIINKLGRAVERSSREKNANTPNDKMHEMLCMQCALQVSMGRDFDDQFGPIHYHILERANRTMFTIPMEDHVILVTANKKISPISLAKKIVNLSSVYTKHTLQNTEKKQIPLVI